MTTMTVICKFEPKRRTGDRLRVRWCDDGEKVVPALVPFSRFASCMDAAAAAAAILAQPDFASAERWWIAHIERADRAMARRGIDPAVQASVRRDYTDVVRFEIGRLRGKYGPPKHHPAGADQMLGGGAA